MHAHTVSDGSTGTIVVVLLLLAAIAAYIGPAVANRRRRPWPAYRCALWTAGIVAIGVSVLRPTVGGTPDFVQHMVDHLLVGMLAPLLLAGAAPATLALRSLHPVPARRFSRLLKSPPLRLLNHPVTALLLNVGGLWAVYSTGVYPSMHDNPLLLLVVHAHFLFAGYLFTAAVIGVDPTPHRRRYAYRAVILGIGLAAHGILSKHLYAHPPTGVAQAEALQGSMLMYYAGDAIDVVLVVVVCAQWFRATRPDAARRSLERPKNRRPDDGVATGRAGFVSTIAPVRTRCAGRAVPPSQENVVDQRSGLSIHVLSKSGWGR
jgi:putative membrane protein